MTKPTKWHVCPVKTQIKLGIRPVRSKSSLSAWRKIGSLATHWAHSEDWSDWTDAQADLSLRWVHRSFYWFCHEVAQLLVTVNWRFRHLVSLMMLNIYSYDGNFNLHLTTIKDFYILVSRQYLFCKLSVTATPKKRGSVSSTDTDGSSPGKFDRKRLSKDVKSYDIIGKACWISIYAFSRMIMAENVTVKIQKSAVIILKFEPCGFTILSNESKRRWRNAKRCWPWSDCWSGSTLFAQVCLSKSFGTLR